MSSLSRRFVFSLCCSLSLSALATVEPGNSRICSDYNGVGSITSGYSDGACREPGHHFFGMKVPHEHILYLDELLDWVERTGLSDQQYETVRQFWMEIGERESSALATRPDQESEPLKDGSLLLFFLNHHDIGRALRLRQHLDMPGSSMSEEDFRRLFPSAGQKNRDAINDDTELFEIPMEGWLDSGGNLYNFTRYAQLDPGWSTSLAYYLGYRLGHIRLAPVESPATVDFSDRNDLSVLVVGDWGTGYWNDGGNPSPAQLVMRSMQKHPAEISIHLGDEYYAGTRETLDGKPGEEAVNFTRIWNPGTPYSFALGSNHGMYDGENGLRYITLDSPRFASQKQSTTFAIILKEWVIVGLDTARYDHSELFRKGALDEAQGDFLHQMGQSGKKVMLVTHHNGLTLDGQEPNNPLWSQVHDYLGRAPDYWIWGHIHQGVAYSDQSAAGTTVGRCWGHGAIPVGRASALYRSDGSLIPEVAYYSDTSFPDPDREQKLRIRNGYGLLRFSGASVTEQMYDQYGVLQWHNVLSFD